MIAFVRRGRVRDAMAGDAPVVGGRARVGEVAPLVEGGRCAVVIVDAERRPIGIVTEEDIEYARERGLLDSPVSMVMREDPLTAREDEPLDEAIRRMEEAGQPCMPVVDGRQRLVGVLFARRAPAIQAIA